MEHYLKVYKEQCWICGSDQLQIHTRYTEGNREKYHITCKNEDCQEFWVETHCWNCGCQRDRRKLGKHYRNYYYSKNKDSWYVECPICRR